ncbi:APC family permease [Streptomyces viridochromogenes]|uniref:APC family permease n=1 Tax=Streptomyces viridochromogenes TaxID=1938 RepID=UPI00069E4D03|nr:APC family permease [Streptomyces viridochromogenes]
MSTARPPALSTRHIVCLVVSAAAPLSAMAGTVPLAFAFGNGAGVPAAFVLTGLVLLCFSASYAVVARRTGGRGGFYSAAVEGLGRPAGVVSGYVAVCAYNLATIGLLGAFGYFTSLVLADHGLQVSWWACAAVGLALVGLLGYRDIGAGARTVAVMMTGELAILLALDIAVVVRDGVPAALPAASFAPHEVFGAGFGVSVMFAAISFIGFESAALYGGEARDPRRSVVRATYVAVVLVAAFYAFTSWVAVGAVGAGRVRQEAGRQLGNLFFTLADSYLGSFAATVMQFMLCTSLFAATLALHSAANRYTQTLAADRLLPSALAATHPRHASPHRAGLAQTVLSAVAVAGFALAGRDPYTGMTTTMLGLGTLGIVALQAVAALSVLGVARRSEGVSPWRIAASVLGFAGLAAAFWLGADNFALMTGS